MRVLVAEDERKVASFIRQGLEGEGHAVEVAADGDADPSGDDDLTKPSAFEAFLGPGPRPAEAP